MNSTLNASVYMYPKGIFDWIKIKWILGGFVVTLGLRNFHMVQRVSELAFCIFRSCECVWVSDWTSRPNWFLRVLLWWDGLSWMVQRMSVSEQVLCISIAVVLWVSMTEWSIYLVHFCKYLFNETGCLEWFSVWMISDCVSECFVLPELIWVFVSE